MTCVTRAPVLPPSLTLQQVKYLVSVIEGFLPKGKTERSGGSRGAPQREEVEIQSKEEFFEGLGNIAEAPKYLRVKGKVRRQQRLGGS